MKPHSDLDNRSKPDSEDSLINPEDYVVVDPSSDDLIAREGALSKEILNSYLYASCQRGAVTCILNALKKGADINFRNPLDLWQTPIMTAVYNNQAAVVELLLERGADPRIPNMNDLNASHLASYPHLLPDIKVMIKAAIQKYERDAKEFHEVNAEEVEEGFYEVSTTELDGSLTTDYVLVGSEINSALAATNKGCLDPSLDRRASLASSSTLSLKIGPMTNPDVTINDEAEQLALDASRSHSSSTPRSVTI
jgi:ankyrin repeat protein